MAKANSKNDEALVAEYYKKLNHPLTDVVAALREIVLSAHPEIGEQIKWNSPSFYFTGTMKPFDPKEYKREIIVFNLHKGRIMLVFPSGAKVNDKSGLLEGDFKDGRRTCVFADLDDVKTKEKALRQVIRTWLTMIEK